ncbi:MAG: hypothetical protein LUI09_07305 [Prevotellaceae bacterium]|nr:hypothetical protein [Prevotellaceae bacterium]
MADGLDTSTKKVTAISATATTSISTDSWYLLKQSRNGISPAYDAGEGSTIMRAASDDAVTAWGDDVIGSYGSDLAKYLLHFVSTSTTASTGTVYNLQFATGNYWASGSYGKSTEVTTTASSDEAGEWCVYAIGSSTEYIAINYYADGSMGCAVNNNGAGDIVNTYNSGEVTETTGNDAWQIFEVTLADMTDDDYEAIAQAERNAELLPLIREADALYESNNTWTYEATDSQTGETNGLITSVEQLSSPFTESKEGALANLLDGNASTFWHSAWEVDGVTTSVDEDYHYLQIELPETFYEEGGDLVAQIIRRSDATSDHITKGALKDATDIDDEVLTSDDVIAILDFPYTSAGETVEDHFYCPAGVKTLRLYNEETAGSAYGRGYFHLAGIQLYPATVSDDCPNALKEDVASTFAAAIKAASETYKAGTTTDDDIADLQTAIDDYTEGMLDLYTLHSCEADISHWTTTGNNGTHEQNTWSIEEDDSGMKTPFCQNYVYEGEDKSTTLTSATISHTQITGLKEGHYHVSLDVRIFAESGATITDGTYLKVNDEKEDIVADGTTGTYDSAAEVYGTYTVTAEVEDEGTLDISLVIPSDANYSWLAWKNLKVTGHSLPDLTAVEGTMNNDVASAQTSALEAYEAEATQDTYDAAVEAIEAAEASVAYYASIAEQLEALGLDEAGTKAWEESTSGSAYTACTLTNDDDITSDLATAVKAQTTPGSDMTYAMLNDGTWAVGVIDDTPQGDGPKTCPSLTTATETYNDSGAFTTGDILYKTLTGLQEGYYVVSFYAQLNACNGVTTLSGDEDTQAYANDETAEMTVGSTGAAGYSDDDLFTFKVKVTEDGTLKFGVSNVAAGGNWCYCQEVSLTYYGEVVGATLHLNKDDGKYYGTFSNAEAATCEYVDGLKAYYITAVTESEEEDNVADLTTVEIEDGVIPAETGCLLVYELEDESDQEVAELDDEPEAEAAAEDEITVYLNTASTEATYDSNLLTACLEGMTITEDNYSSVYVLNYVSEETVVGQDADENDVYGIGLAFYHMDTDNSVAAGTAYLSWTGSTSDVKIGRLVFGSSDTTGIETVAPAAEGADAIYDLAGRKVSKPQKGGIYISQGKKVLY